LPKHVPVPVPVFEHGHVPDQVPEVVHAHAPGQVLDNKDGNGNVLENTHVHRTSTLFSANR